MELALHHYFIAIGGAFIAGIINTMAGNGSAITLAILMDVIGLPGNVANGTNRVGIFFQSLAGTLGFWKNDKLNLDKNSKWICISVVLGALIGIYIATQISGDQFKQAYKYIMVLMLVVILTKPKRWLIKGDQHKKIKPWVYFILFLLGIHVGFINMGFGIFFLMITVLLAKYNIIAANGIKNLVVVVLCIFALIIFHFNDMIFWKIGMLMAIGQTIGGFFAAHYATKYDGMEIWAYRLLVVIVIYVLLNLFGFFSLFG